MRPAAVAPDEGRLHVVPPGLETRDFRQIGVRGVGDPHNTYAHSMVWFKDCLYVGTSRNNLWLVKRRGRVAPPPEMECWPVPVPDPMPPEKMRAQILRYDPRRGEWTLVYESPIVMRDGKPAPRDLGYRGMVVFQGRSDPEPALYAAGTSSEGLHLLRSLDGEHFEEIGEPGFGDPRMVSARSMLEWRGRLYVTPVGATGKTPNETEVPVILESDDPAAGRWREVCVPSFGEDTNKAIAEIEVFDDHLYAATLNPSCGFQLYKTRGEGEPPYRWTRVMTAGAYRGYLNEGIAHMCEFGGALYLATGIAGGGYNRWHQIGPAAAEVLRIFPNGSWDLLVGSPRLTPAGLKLPLSGLGAGFNHPLNGYMWRVCEHEGWLYVGTYNSAVFFPFKPVKVPERVFEMLKLRDMDELLARYGGCHLWRTQDGERFYPITTNGFGTPYNYGVRQLLSTPSGLFVGTANPFGPQVGVKRDGQWRYEENPRGGMEVWLGDRGGRQGRAELLRRRGTAAVEQRETLASLASVSRALVYTRVAEHFYDQSGYSQMGYWERGTRSAREACDNLVEKLAALDPGGAGPVLNVTVCDQGATTEALARRYPAESITAVDVLPVSLDLAEKRLPQANFKLGYPPRLDFPDATFGTLFCIERACYFNTRRQFLKEALRVLKPGGRLVLSDILYTRTGEALNIDRHRQNYLANPAAYERLLRQAGFTDVRVTDATGPCARVYMDRIRKYFTEGFLSQEIGEGDFNTLMSLLSLHVLFLNHYVLATATRPD